MYSRGSKLSAGRKTSIARTLQGNLDQNLPGEYKLLDDISAKAPRRRIIKEITTASETTARTLRGNNPQQLNIFDKHNDKRINFQQAHDDLYALSGDSRIIANENSIQHVNDTLTTSLHNIKFD